MACIVIVRHGDTFAPGEAPRRIGARTDLPLVERGRAQARALAAEFAERDIAFDRVLASPLLRTRETAQTIAPGRIETAAWLREIDHGPDEGRVEEEVLARIGHAALDAWEREAVPPPGWIVDADERLAAWRTFLAGAAGTVLLVTSNGAARFALLALGLAPAKIRTGAYGVVEDGRLTCWDRRPD
jgi:broad specificity phosphatase PhoE